jgi:hypothetical protein
VASNQASACDRSAPDGLVGPTCTARRRSSVRRAQELDERLQRGSRLTARRIIQKEAIDWRVGAVVEDSLETPLGQILSHIPSAVRRH